MLILPNMATTSVWQKTRTHFPLFENLVGPPASEKRIFVLGGADGKFVIPLAKKGWSITTIDTDSTALYGGITEFPKGQPFSINGLSERLMLENIPPSQVHMQVCDFMQMKLPTSPHHAIWTSCSWHYSANFKYPLQEWIGKMQQIIEPDGIWGAEYMMPCERENWKHQQDHYPEEGAIAVFFSDNQWEILHEFYTPVFDEAPHVGNLEHHQHRMGVLIARKRHKEVMY